MFDGIPNDQFHQFIASRTSFPTNPLSFPANGSLSYSASGFEPYPSSIHTQKLHHQAESESVSPDTITKNSEERKQVGDLTVERERLTTDPNWSDDEVLALLKVRSSMENWFPELNWELVSRKLGELGFKRSGEACKEKFEEVSHHLQNKMLGGVEELRVVADEELAVSAERSENTGNQEENSGNGEEVVKSSSSREKKRKRKDKFETLKVFCENVVKSMMSQMEEFHDKLIEEIVKRDEEKIAREEAWKNQEMERMKTEIEIRTREQAVAVERQSAIVEFLKRFTSQDPNNSNSHLAHEVQELIVKVTNTTNNSISKDHQNIPILSPKDSNYEEKDKRWPRDQVLALINLRSKLSSSNVDENKEGAKAAPLWERISQGMMELGYKKSAKRCKEKWENINKYFRKTKDSNRKRSVDSRTCPYFHQLSCLYNEGTLVPQSEN